MPLFLLEVENGVADRLLLVLVERNFLVADDILDDDTLAREDALALAEVEEVFRGQALVQVLLEVGEATLFFFGEVVERATEEDTGGEAGVDANFVAVLRLAGAFEVCVFAVFVVTLPFAVEPAVLDGEFAGEAEFGADIRTRTALGVGVREFALGGRAVVEDTGDSVFSHSTKGFKG